MTVIHGCVIWTLLGWDCGYMTVSEMRMTVTLSHQLSGCVRVGLGEVFLWMAGACLEFVCLFLSNAWAMAIRVPVCGCIWRTIHRSVADTVTKSMSLTRMYDCVTVCD